MPLRDFVGWLLAGLRSDSYDFLSLVAKDRTPGFWTCRARKDETASVSPPVQAVRREHEQCSFRLEIGRARHSVRAGVRYFQRRRARNDAPYRPEGEARSQHRAEHRCTLEELRLIIGPDMSRTLRRWMSFAGWLVLEWVIMTSAAEEAYVVRSWQTEDGLPQNSGKAIVQTADGYVWVGTFNGLVRFNGRDFTRFTIGNTKELPSDDITELLQDRAGRLWIGTSSGLASCERGRFVHWQSPEKLRRARIYDLVETPEGDLIVMAYEGAWRISSSGVQEINFPLAQWPTTTSSAVTDPAGNVWLAHFKSLYRLRGAELSLENEFDQPIRLLAAGSDGTIWYSDRDVHMRWKRGQPPEKAPLDAGRITAMQATGDGGWWIGSSDKGLYHWREGETKALTTTNGLTNDRILALTMDCEGNLWVGTDGGGISRVKPAVVTTYGVEHGLSYFDVLSVAEDKAGRIWLGIFGGGLCVGTDGQWQRFHEAQLLGSNETVSALAVGRDGTVWVGRLSRSLCRLRGSQLEVELRSHVRGVLALFEDRDGALWVGSDGEGLECIREEETRRWDTTNGLSDDRVSAIAQDGSGGIWIGTRHGLNRIRDHRIERFHAKDGLGADAIHCLFVDRDGTLWIGTRGGGLTRYRDGKFASATSQNGLSSDVIAQILEDDNGQFWMGSPTGIFRVGKQALHDLLDGRSRFVACVRYGKKDGMRSVDCPGGFQPACAKTQDGRLWFCTAGGVTVADPRKMGNPLPAPAVHVERVLADGIELGTGANRFGVLASGLPAQWLPGHSGRRDSNDSGLAVEDAGVLDTQIMVPPGANRLEFHCAALSFSAPEQAQFKFWLEGYEDDWQVAGQRRVAQYTRVPPGDYRFHIKAASADGVWNEVEATLALVIRPTWRQAWWYPYALVLTGLIALYAFYHNRISEFKRARSLQAAFSRQLIESQEQERKRIAAELHDGLGQSLLVIRNRSKLGLADAATPELLREQMEHISGLSASAVEEIRNISQNLRPYQLDRLGLTRALQFLLQTVSTSIRVVDEIDPVDRLFPAEFESHLFRIAQEFLSNTVKHSQATVVRFLVRREARVVSFRFVDNGCGFQCQAVLGSNGKSEGLGLRGIAERLRILGAEPEFRSHPGRGTRLSFTIRVPPATGQA